MTGLRPHQHEPVAHLLDILRRERSACDLSDTGTGKTYVAAAVAATLKLPTLVITPKVAINQWHRAAEHFGDSLSVTNYEMLRTGRTPYGKWDRNPPAGMRSERYFVCEWCQQIVDLDDYRPCYCHPAGTHCVNEKKKSWKYGKFHFHQNVGMVIFDEGHRCGALDSLNADMMVAARCKSLVLSATAACSPLKMFAMGYLLDVHTGNFDMPLSGRKRFYSWACNYGVRREPMRGLQWRVSAEQQGIVMAEIRKQIIPARGVRLCVEDIPGFPKREITSELYDLDEIDKINGLYDLMAEALRRLDSRASMDADSANPLTTMLRARQKIELLKTPIAVELARDYVARGHQVAIFANFTETLNELCTRLSTRCCIRGSQRESERQAHIDNFQAGRESTIIVNNEAGGVALSLPGDRRIGLVFPPDKAITLKQVFGRLHRDGGGNCHYRVLFAAKTVEAKVHKNLQTKLNNLDALNDADLDPHNLEFESAESS